MHIYTVDEKQVTYVNLKKKKHEFTVTASTTDEETVSKKFTFESKYGKLATFFLYNDNATIMHVDRKFCQVYMCTDDVVTNDDSANITFTSDDPGASFKCILNERRIRPCTWLH